MSLHIGRISPDVRQPYLEHLFQKYGRCVVNLKDGYGFAVYDSNADAARALRELHGIRVCGRDITVNWSKQQPRCSQDFRTSSRFVESSHRRTSRDGRGNIRFGDSLAVKNHLETHDECHDKNHPASHANNPPANDGSHGNNHQATHDESHDPASAQEKEYDKLAESVNDAEENIVEEASLGQVKRDEDCTVDASAIEHERWAEAGKGTPGDGDGFDCYEPYHGLDRQKETEDVVKAISWDSHDNRRSKEKWQEHSGGRRVDISHDDKFRSPTCYTCGVFGHIARYCPQEMGAKFKARRDGLNFREKLELRRRRFGFPTRRWPEFHVHPMDQKRHRVQDGRKPLSDVKKRVPMPSNVHREGRGHDHISEMRQPTKETRKRSRSERSSVPSLSSEPSKHSRKDNVRESHSNQTSSDSRCRSPHSRSRFRVHSPSCSAHSSSKSSQPTQREGLRSNINHPVPFSTSTLPQHESSPDEVNKNSDGLMNSPLGDDSEFRTTPEIKHMNNSKQEGKGSALDSEVPITSFSIDTLSDGEAFVPDKCANVVGVSLDKSSAHYNDNVASGVQSQNANFDDTSLVKSNQGILVKKDRSKSLKLTTNEVISALKHYRMETHEVDSLDEPVEKYFGAARLWPWEIIYYRRLKKGPISTENYAKRLEQNKEFGIVDQYVRSSSGWWE